MGSRTHMHHPVLGDPGLLIQPQFGTEVISEAGFGHFDQQQRVGGGGYP